jgi:homocysteine S-methyltransferase
MSSLRDLIDDGRVHVVDGAMGTALYGKGMFVNVCYDELNLTHAELVKEVHEGYVRAGAEIIETNTFGANPVKLSSYGLEERTAAINTAAASLARDVAGKKVCVAGAIGPLGIRIEPWGPTSHDEAEEYFRHQVRGLLEGGVDGFCLETFSDLDELHAAYRAVRSLSDLPVIAQMTIDESGQTAYGTDAEHIAAALTEFGSDVVGLNCSVGPAIMLEGIERMAEVAERPLTAQPNAGLPRVVGDRKIYLSSPEYMANYAQRLIRAGARFVGGCCGTTHEHIKAISDLVATTQPRQASVVVAKHDVAAAAEVEPVPLAERSEWGRKLAAGEFVTNVELIPPKGWQSDALVAHARALAEAGVDAVSILDGPRAQSRMGNRNGRALHVPRPQHAGDAQRLAGRRGSGAQKPAPDNRRSAAHGTVSGFHRSVRHRLDRANQRRVPSQSRARPRWRVARRPDPIRGRRRAQSDHCRHGP